MFGNIPSALKPENLQQEEQWTVGVKDSLNFVFNQEAFRVAEKDGHYGLQPNNEFGEEYFNNMIQFAGHLPEVMNWEVLEIRLFPVETPGPSQA